MQKNIILYHKNCLDGFCSAWVAWRKFGNNALYIPVSDRAQLPEEIWQSTDLKTNTLYIIDFCYPKEVIEKCKIEFKEVVILDHHVSSKNDITSADIYVYGTDKSGAYLAWEYFFNDTQVPKLVEYISDGDIWTHKLLYSKQVLQYIYNQDFTFESFESLYEACQHDFERVVDIGTQLLQGHNKKVEIAIEQAELVEFEGYKVYAVNAGFGLTSDVGHILAEKTNSFSLVFAYDKERWKCSLRSVLDFDVSQIAEKYGGGGHKNAAAFIVKTDFPISFIKNST